MVPKLTNKDLKDSIRVAMLNAFEKEPTTKEINDLLVMAKKSQQISKKMVEAIPPSADILDIIHAVGFLVMLVEEKYKVDILAALIKSSPNNLEKKEIAEEETADYIG
ncbi:MAG: hypothetical protein Q8O68_00655 [Candidatus Daviesbacteria bacterium]|nr:hypothetical protein [Candidatus Daviesbacteria bacterium]